MMTVSGREGHAANSKMVVCVMDANTQIAVAATKCSAPDGQAETILKSVGGRIKHTAPRESRYG